MTSYPCATVVSLISPLARQIENSLTTQLARNSVVYRSFDYTPFTKTASWSCTSGT